MLVGDVVVEDGVDGLAGRGFPFNGIRMRKYS
jgi:hypothetical protein